MANTKKVEKGIPITVWLDEETVKLIDELAHKADMSRSRLVRNLIKVGAEEFRTLESWGLVTVVRMVEAATGSVKAIMQKFLASKPE